MMRLLCLAAILAIVGCGANSSRYKIVPVEGTLLFSSGTPLPKGTRLRLDPAEGGVKTASATIDSSGAFRLTHVSGRSGAELGKYTVVLMPPTTDPGDFNRLVPRAYCEGSGNLVAEIKDGMGPLELKVHK
jgi:hypothetical protein